MTNKLITDTSNALHVTLNGIVKLITLLLKKIKYVLTLEFQIDRIASEFETYQQLSGLSYDILAQQISNNVAFQRFKLFNKLNQKRSSSHHYDSYCIEILGEHENDALNECIEESSKLNEIERSSLYYICGYVAHKQKNMNKDPNQIGSKNELESQRHVTREKKELTKEELFYLSFHL